MQYIRNVAVVLAMVLFSFQLAFSQNKPHTLLWEISKKDINHKSYLFGTFHEVNPDFFDSIKLANDYLKESRVLLVEAYEAPNPNGTANEESKPQAYTWNKTKWDSLLNASQREKFAAYAKSMYGDEEMYRSSPQLLTFLLLRNYFQGICDTANRKSFDLMDNRIIDIGLKNNLQVIGLEQDQVNIINTTLKADANLSDRNSANRVLELMDYISKGNSNTEIAKALLDYKKFDIDYHFDTDLKSAENLINARNNNWMKAIPNYIGKNKCFIAVGFRHLGLKNGLIAQLRHLGYTVTPVKI